MNMKRTYTPPQVCIFAVNPANIIAVSPGTHNELSNEDQLSRSDDEAHNYNIWSDEW